MNITELREAIRLAFRGKPVSRVDLFGSAARGEMTPESDVDILVTPKPEATRRDLFIMAADVEEALGRPVDFLVRADVEAMKNREASDLILKERGSRLCRLRKSCGSLILSKPLTGLRNISTTYPKSHFFGTFFARTPMIRRIQNHR